MSDEVTASAAVVAIDWTSVLLVVAGALAAVPAQLITPYVQDRLAARKEQRQEVEALTKTRRNLYFDVLYFGSLVLNHIATDKHTPLIIAGLGRDAVKSLRRFLKGLEQLDVHLSSHEQEIVSLLLRMGPIVLSSDIEGFEFEEDKKDEAIDAGVPNVMFAAMALELAYRIGQLAKMGRGTASEVHGAGIVTIIEVTRPHFEKHEPYIVASEEALDRFRKKS